MHILIVNAVQHLCVKVGRVLMKECSSVIGLTSDLIKLDIIGVCVSSRRVLATLHGFSIL